MKQSAKIALCGVLGALAVVCMMLTVIPVSTLALTALAGIVLMPVSLEGGVKWGFAAYAAAAALTFFIAPDFEAKLLFIAFFGYYPTLKLLLDRLASKVLQWVLKLLLFNAAVVAVYLLLMFVGGLEPDEFEVFGINMPLALLGLANVVFVIFDKALDGLKDIYKARWHKIFARVFK